MRHRYQHPVGSEVGGAVASVAVTGGASKRAVAGIFACAEVVRTAVSVGVEQPVTRAAAEIRAGEYCAE